jgi:hypothetical protein
VTIIAAGAQEEYAVEMLAPPIISLAVNIVAATATGIVIITDDDLNKSKFNLESSI